MGCGTRIVVQPFRLLTQAGKPAPLTPCLKIWSDPSGLVACRAAKSARL